MEIGGYSSAASNYYAEFARRRGGALPAEDPDPSAAAYTATGSQSAAEMAAPENAAPAAVAAASPVAEAAAGSSAAGAVAGQDLLSLLANSPVTASESGTFANTDTSRGSIFNEMLKSFGVAGDHSRAQQYMQETLRRTYGIM